MAGEDIAIKQNIYMRKFRKAGAIDPAHARSLADLHMRSTFVFRGMLNKGVFVEAGNDTYYMDNEAAAEFKARRLKIMLFVFGLVVLAGLILFILNGGHFK